MVERIDGLTVVHLGKPRWRSSQIAAIVLLLLLVEVSRHLRMQLPLGAMRTSTVGVVHSVVFTIVLLQLIVHLAHVAQVLPNALDPAKQGPAAVHV